MAEVVEERLGERLSPEPPPASALRTPSPPLQGRPAYRRAPPERVEETPSPTAQAAADSQLFGFSPSLGSAAADSSGGYNSYSSSPYRSPFVGDRERAGDLDSNEYSGGGGSGLGFPLRRRSPSERSRSPRDLGDEGPYVAASGAQFSPLAQSTISPIRGAKVHTDPCCLVHPWLTLSEDRGGPAAAHHHPRRRGGQGRQPGGAARRPQGDAKGRAAEREPLPLAEQPAAGRDGRQREAELQVTVE